MKLSILTISLFLTLNAFGQLTKNDSGVYEYRIEASDNDELEKLINDGSFTHMVNGYAPVEISFNKALNDNGYILTNFKTKGGVSLVPVALEELPKKAQKKWVAIIEKKIVF